jgi:hypothetical protein
MENGRWVDGAAVQAIGVQRKRELMGYVKPTSAQDIKPATIATLARLLGLQVSPEESTTLAANVRDQLASIKSLEDLDLTDIAPTLEFDPRWAS